MYCMNKKSELLKLIPELGILPLFFHNDPEVSIRVLESLYRAGIRAVEYTNRGETALANFKKMRHACNTELTAMYLGIGTIKDGATAQIKCGTDCRYE